MTDQEQRAVLVAGGGGFIGGHLVASLLARGHEVRAVDCKNIGDWQQVHDGAVNVVADLSLLDACGEATAGIQDVYNLAADMGGMGFIENNKALCMLSVLINTHLLVASRDAGVVRYFFASSACVYAADKQTSPEVTALAEDDVYPAEPEDGYGWEKLFSERMCRHFTEDFELTTRVARFHNVYGPRGTWRGGREKAPAAISRKVAEAKASGDHVVEVWGDGEQTRSFMYIDDCLEGVHRIMESAIDTPINLGSAELVTINGLVELAGDIAGISVTRRHDLAAPQGVRGRNSDNTQILARLGWEPSTSLRDGMGLTYAWVAEQVETMREPA
jgi:nucleoside-diphosphate-sugar epimerase